MKDQVVILVKDGHWWVRVWYDGCFYDGQMNSTETVFAFREVLPPGAINLLHEYFTLKTNDPIDYSLGA